MFILSGVERGNVRMSRCRENGNELFGISTWLWDFCQRTGLWPCQDTNSYAQLWEQTASPPFVSPNQLATHPRLVPFPGHIKEPFTVSWPVSPEEKTRSIDKFVLASSYLETIEKGTPRQSWTQLLSTDYTRGDKGRCKLKFQSSTLPLTQGFYIGSCHDHVQSHWQQSWDKGSYSTFRSLTRKKLTWEIQHVENLRQFPWNIEDFLWKGEKWMEQYTKDLQQFIQLS